MIRRCTDAGVPAIERIVNEAAVVYERHGFRLVTPERKDVLLQTYWKIPDRQRETSVVLERHPPARNHGPCGDPPERVVLRATIRSG